MTDITREREMVIDQTALMTDLLVDGVGVAQAEQRISDLNHEKVELESKLDEDQEDMNEIVNKHKTTLQQVCRKVW